MADFFDNLRKSMAEAFNNYDIYLKGQGDSDAVKKAKKKVKSAENSVVLGVSGPREKLQQAYVDQWTNYKNDRIEAVSGKTIGDWAREGKMFDDDGNLLDIDYTYYATVPYATLQRVFGDGADDVWNVISRKFGITNKR